MALTDAKIRTAKPADRPYKLQDGYGLYLDVRPSGTKVWRYRYWMTPTKDGIYTIGDYPHVSLADARKERERIRDLVKSGKNPTAERKLDKLRQRQDDAVTLRAVAQEWHDENSPHWSETYSKQVKRYLWADLLDKYGDLPLREVSSAQILAAIQAVEKRGAKSIAKLIRQWVGAVYRYAIATLRADSDPTAALRGAIRMPAVRHNKPLKPSSLPEFLQSLDAYSGYGIAKPAAQFMLLTFVRTIEIRRMEWIDVDLDGAIWRIPAEKMKMGTEHIVPLSRQALVILRDMREFTGHRAHVFPNVRRPNDAITGTTINRVIERIGFKGVVSGHGFRSTASTMLHELGYQDLVIERQLAHMERNKVKAAYNHAEYLPDRRKMMQDWADFLDQQRQKR